MEIVSKSTPFTVTVTEFQSSDVQTLRTKLKAYERTRALWFWSDHSVLESYGLVLFVVGVVYDPLVFYTENELDESHKMSMSLQELIEQGEIR